MLSYGSVLANPLWDRSFLSTWLILISLCYQLQPNDGCFRIISKSWLHDCRACLSSMRRWWCCAGRPAGRQNKKLGQPPSWSASWLVDWHQEKALSHSIHTLTKSCHLIILGRREKKNFLGVPHHPLLLQSPTGKKYDFVLMLKMMGQFHIALG